MPGMILQPEQLQRLCGINASVCQSALEALVESKFLSLRSNGAYGRVTTDDGPDSVLDAERPVSPPLARPRSRS
jgi:hypothetical protein